MSLKKTGKRAEMEQNHIFFCRPKLVLKTWNYNPIYGSIQEIQPNTVNVQPNVAEIRQNCSKNQANSVKYIQM